MLAGSRIAEHGAGAGIVGGIDHELVEFDRESFRQRRLHSLRMARIDADGVAAAGVDARLVEGLFQGHAVIDQERTDLVYDYCIYYSVPKSYDWFLVYFSFHE